MDTAVHDRERLFEMINGAWMCQAIAAACELGVADRLAQGAASPAELARALDLAPDAVRRLLRALASLGLVTEGAQEASLTASGRLLASGTDGSLRDWALMNASRGWAAWGHLRMGLRTGRNIRDEAGLAAFAELEGEDAERFNRAMIDLTRPVAAALAETPYFSGARTVVDVGGGAGHLLLPLLARHPKLEGIVFDLPHARELAQLMFRESGLASRCRFVAGSFFDGISAGGDVYLLKSVLHNWPDDRALDILRHCRQAMRDGTRLLVVERILAENTTDTSLDRENARSDLQMMLACDGRERTEREFTRLLQEAGFEKAGTTALTPLIHAIAAVAA
jgi:hypothetical protein